MFTTISVKDEYKSNDGSSITTTTAANGSTSGSSLTSSSTPSFIVTDRDLLDSDPIRLDSVIIKPESVPKLTAIDTKTFQDWKNRMLAIFNSYGIGCVLTTAPASLVASYVKALVLSLPPGTKETEDSSVLRTKALKLVKNHNTQAYSALLTACGSGPASVVTQAVINHGGANPDVYVINNGYFMWRSIIEKYECKTFAGTIGAFLRLYDFKYQSHQHPDTIIQYYDELNREIMAGGGIKFNDSGSLPDIFKLAGLLKALPTDLGTLYQLITARKNVTFKEAVETIRSNYEATTYITNHKASSNGSSIVDLTGGSANHVGDRRKKKHSDGTDTVFSNGNAGGNNDSDSEPVAIPVANECKYHPYVGSTRGKHTTEQCRYTNTTSTHGGRANLCYQTYYSDSDDDNEVSLDPEVVLNCCVRELTNGTTDCNATHGVSSLLQLPCSGARDITTDDIIYDSAVTHHTFGNTDLVTNVKSITPIQMACYNNASFTVSGAGHVKLNPSVELSGVVIGPNGCPNLVSATRIADTGLTSVITASGVSLYHPSEVTVTGAPILFFSRVGNLYKFTGSTDCNCNGTHTTPTVTTNSVTDVIATAGVNELGQAEQLQY